MNIQHDYENNLIQGWAGEDLAREQWNMIKSDSCFVPFKAYSSIGAKRKMFLWEILRKVIGKDRDVPYQEVGDCVSQGAKTAGEYLQCAEILLNNDLEKYRSLFAPYFYGCGRVFVGKNQIRGDGSLGSWQASAVIKYGALAQDEEGVPPYSGAIARQWGSGQGPPQKYVDFGKKHPIKSASLIKTWDELCDALMSGYPVTVASSAGFSMQPDRSGFHRRTTTWMHQMCFIGIDETFNEDYAVIQNSWGANAHGTLKDFHSDMVYPGGCLRVTRKDAEFMLAQGDSFAYSAFEGFEDRSREIQKSLFKMI